MNLEDKEQRYSIRSTYDEYGCLRQERVPVGYKFDEADRMEIVAEYLESGLPACKIIEKYKIQNRVTLFTWMDRFLNENEEMVKEKSKTSDNDESRESMLKEIRQLKKALKVEKMRADLFSTIIDLAEAQFNIPIRKKSGAKQ